MKIINSEVILVSGRFRNGMIKEEIFDERGKRLKPYKKEEHKKPRPHTLSYYRLSHGKYQIKKNVSLKNGQRGILYQTLEISEDGIDVRIEKCEGNLPKDYLQHISAP
jgi:hypothetical protein